MEQADTFHSHSALQLGHVLSIDNFNQLCQSLFWHIWTFGRYSASSLVERVNQTELKL